MTVSSTDSDRGKGHEQIRNIGGILGVLEIQEKILAGANHNHAGALVSPDSPYRRVCLGAICVHALLKTMGLKGNKKDIEISDEMIAGWQSVVNTLAEIIDVPAALIMKVDPPHIEVFRASESGSNPYRA